MIYMAQPSSYSKLETGTFFLILVFFSIVLIYIMLPFAGSILWAVILAILFSPLQRKLTILFRGRAGMAAFISMVCCTLIVIIPVIFVINSLVQEGRSLSTRLASGSLDFGVYLKHITDSLPESTKGLLDRAGWTGDLEDIRLKLADFAGNITAFVSNQAFSLGQVTVQFVLGLCIMLYLLFFLLRDGADLIQKIRLAIPLTDYQKTNLLDKFATVIRATIKGSLIVAIIQGFLGGVAFWFYGIQGPVLWGVIMSVLALVPAVGSSLVWLPVAIYFLVSNMVWQGVTLILYGVFVIALVDNIVRPMLVGKDIKLPDWMIMLSTLGAIAGLGVNGFVLGPLIAAMFVASWSVLTEKRMASQGQQITN